MVVLISLPSSVLHTVKSFSTPGRVPVDSVHHPAILVVLPDGDRQLRLPVSRLSGVSVLSTIILDAGVQVGVVVLKHVVEQLVVVGRVRGVLVDVGTRPPRLLFRFCLISGRHLLLSHGRSWW
jgi:hypothetical protein